MSLTAADVLDLVLALAACLFGVSCLASSIFFLVRPQRAKSFYPEGRKGYTGTRMTRVSAIIGTLMGAGALAFGVSRFFF